MSRFVARLWTLLAATVVCTSPLFAQAASPAKPIHVKVVVVTMFERGEDTGDAPGEFQLWVEREHLDRVLPLPAGYHHVRMNGDGVLGMLTGVGTAKAAASVMALGLDPRFDFSKAYWIVAGIGGGDPADVSLGSAVWANHVIDSDLGLRNRRARDSERLAHGLHAAEQGDALRRTRSRSNLDGELYTLNPQLVAWAFQLTKNVPLADSESLRESRARFAGFPNAHEAAFCNQRRRDVRRHFLARHSDGPMGQRLGILFYRRPRKLHGLGDGRHRHDASVNISEPRRAAWI